MPNGACEPLLYHSQEKFGFFSILQSLPSGKRQRTYRLNQMSEVIQNLDHNLDTWITQADFKGYNRRIVNFLRVGLAWVDLDYYNSEHAGSAPEKLAEQLLWYCQYEGIPSPSIIIYSGRGLQVKWLFNSPIPAQALIRWNTLQKYICERFELFGADAKAKDASRVLRLVDSINTKSGDKCRIIFGDSLSENGATSYPFDYLCDAFFPYSREEMQQLKSEQNERKQQKQRFKVIQGNKTSHVHTFNEQTLNWHRLLDLRKLCRLRGWSEGVAPGFQDWCLFLAVCFLSWSVKPNRLFQEIHVLANEFCPTWRPEESIAITKSAIARAHDAMAGKKVQFDGKLRDPRYKFTNAYLIETLDITDDEQKVLLTIIDVKESRRRDREAATHRRRQAGVVDRATYQLTAEQRRTEARLRHAKGENYKEIAKALCISVDTVKGYIYRRV